MTIVFLIVLAIAIGMGVALYFQMQASRKQAEAQEQLLKDYQRRVDEQQKLLDDFRALEKNFDSVGEGYEQALLSFEKMEEENQKLQSIQDELQKRCSSLEQQNAKLNDAARRSGEVLERVVNDMRQMAKETGDNKLIALAGRISDMDDIDNEQPINRIDNVLVTQVAGEAIAVSGINKAGYLKFDLQVAPDAAATMLSTNLQKAVRSLTHVLDNAMKFTTEGTVKLLVAVDMDKMQAIYTVEDTGSGIAAEDAERIFEPYVKLNQYFDGLGVGLTVARGIARRLSGDLIYEPVPEGTGSRFVLTLPI